MKYFVFYTIKSPYYCIGTNYGQDSCFEFKTKEELIAFLNTNSVTFEDGPLSSPHYAFSSPPPPLNLNNAGNTDIQTMPLLNTVVYFIKRIIKGELVEVEPKIEEEKQVVTNSKVVGYSVEGETIPKK